MSAANTLKKYPDVLRRVKAVVEVDGKKIEMTFLTNNFQWSPRTIAELYRRRWAIEIFFKEIKQTLQLADFIGYNDKAVKWQVWIGLLTHMLLRLLKHLSKWKLSFPGCTVSLNQPSGCGLTCSELSTSMGQPPHRGGQSFFQNSCI